MMHARGFARLSGTFILSALLLRPAPGLAGGGHGFSPGAAGIGDPYFPLAGNGGYDVEDYHLEVRYDPATDELRGKATITARATQDLSRFNLDLDGLTVDGVSVERRAASFARDGSELTITPARGIRAHSRFVTVVRYHGVPEPVVDASGAGGFFHTPDGALVVGEPFVAATWFPANDHPRDAATYTLDITGPADLDVIANGRLVGQHACDGWRTWRWRAREPMTSYLVGWTMGKYAVNAYRQDGLRFVDAVDVDLFTPPLLPVSGEALALSGQADLSYKRMTREIAVPPSGGVLGFWAHRDTEPAFDFFFVEARVAGTDAWTTLPDLDGRASQDVGACVLPFVHPFAANYLQPLTEPPFCAPSGLTGEWWAASGASDGWEPWRVDLSAYAGQTVEISLAYASDDVVQGDGVAIDDITFTSGEGATSFEGSDSDGWQVPGAAPPGSFNANDWFIGTAADLPPAPGETVLANLERQPEIIQFLGSHFTPYPFDDAGAIVHDMEGVFFALENQTRPIYHGNSLANPGFGPISLLVHEIAHQWYGDRVRLGGWQHIWLNEGFATYASWLWFAEKEGFPIDLFFDSIMSIPETSSFWSTPIGDPGPERLFVSAVYNRGAATLHALRRAVGDEAFFEILRRWGARTRIATSADFIALAEAVSGQELGELFEVWLFTAGKPVIEPPASPALRAGASADDQHAVRALLRLMARQKH
jgi:hypothetical protein